MSNTFTHFVVFADILKPVLLTGAAGFIGMHTVRRLIAEGNDVVGIDNLNDYYDPALKQARLRQLGIDTVELQYNTSYKGLSGFTFYRMDITDERSLMALFAKYTFDEVIHLAAQAGVRYSLQNPRAYMEANINGFFNIMEACRIYPVQHLVFASSSSVYGNSDEVPFSTHQRTDTPVSLYAATKKSNEIMAHAYSHLHGIPTTGLRFFTVYGPWGRPDMAYYSFAQRIQAGMPIQVFHEGQLRRDFTYIDDIVEGIIRLLPLPPNGSPKYRLLNIGNSQPVELGVFIATLEQLLNRKAIIEYLPMQAGDVIQTFADTSEIEALTGFKPATSLEDGLRQFVAWMPNAP